MIFSTPLLGTNTKKTKLSWLEYIWFSCILQGWYNCWYAFKNWADLMGGSYQEYAILKDDDPLELCILYFWDSLEDEIYSKKFLEELLQMSYEVDMGIQRTYPFDEVSNSVIPITEDYVNRLKDLVKDVEIDIDEPL